MGVLADHQWSVLEPLLNHATTLRAYGQDTDGASAPSASVWVLDLPGARLTIGLSPEKSRGFSGEGAVLHTLSGAEVSDDADLVSALLSSSSGAAEKKRSRFSHCSVEDISSAVR